MHLDDLCCADPVLKLRIDRILQEKVYPLVRAAFREDEDEPEPKGSICVYDSIFIRYNAEIAKAAGLIGASQPLVSKHVVYSSYRDSFPFKLTLYILSSAPGRRNLFCQCCSQ